MRTQLVVTLVGPDQVGLVDRFSQVVLKHDGNVEESRMARLGGDFAMIVLASVPEHQLQSLEAALTLLNKEGLQISTRRTAPDKLEAYEGWIPFRVSVTGADHEGIVNAITQILAQNNINVDEMETGTSAAPMSGTILFSMKAVVVVPPHVSYRDWCDPLEQTADELNLTIDITPYS
ncbi:MAG: transcriptional regulator [Candidatus Latescibacteria bacterium]|jgi:glycine cleavage system transcriptional repressor|nr:transcriptional regulator [Candidatus Latescibacterota bacterium]